MPKQRLIAVHLLNDYSGSPQVFKQSLKALKPYYHIHLYTATPGGSGILSGLDDVREHKLFYRNSSNKFITLALFFYSQLSLFIWLTRTLKQGDTVYINTLLPFGAALAANMRKCRVFYHVHEVSLRPALLKWMLVKIAGSCATQFLFVSRYVAEHFQFRQPGVVIYNSLPEHFIQEANRHQPLIKTPFTAVMLCSLKNYKGIHEFIEVSRTLSDIRFILVLNASPQKVAVFKKNVQPPANCDIYPEQTNTVPFYQNAHAVLNLSHPDKWIETFGLTLLEGMYFGLPVIAPSAGGPLELVSPGKEGFVVFPKNILQVRQALQALSGNLPMYLRMSAAAKEKAKLFSPQSFQIAIKNAFADKPATVQKMETNFRGVDKDRSQTA